MIGRLPKPQNCRPMEKNYNKVVIIYFLSADEKRADKLADCRPTVGEVNVIAVLGTNLQLNVFTFNNVYLSIKIYSSIHLVIFAAPIFKALKIISFGFYDNITIDWS